MLSVIILILIVLFILFTRKMAFRDPKKKNEESEYTVRPFQAWTAFVLFVLIFIFSVIWIVFLANTQTEFVIDNKIQICEDINQQIEEEFASTVNAYQEFEKETNTNLKVDSEEIMAVIQKYPEISSDTMVQKKMELHKKNKEEIKNLRIEKNNLLREKWWLYFYKNPITK